MKSRKYFQLSAIAIVAIFISALFVTACHDDNDNNNSTTLQQAPLTEKEFVNDSSLRANPEVGVVAAFLEPSSASEIDNLTGELGFDIFRYRYDRTLNHRFCFINSDEGSKHSITLQSTEGNEILSTEAEGDCVEARLEPGHYDLVLTHGEHIDAIDNIFLITLPDGQEFGMRETINQNRFAEFFESIRNIFTKEAIAQTTDDNVITLVSTNSCVGCDLSGTDLTGNDFTAANLTGADLSGSSLSGVSLSEATLLTANLSGADLSDTNGTTDLSGANLTAANLSNADLTGADLSGAILVTAVLANADITDADFDNADLTLAIWTNETMCGIGSIGFCLNPILEVPKVCESIRRDVTDEGVVIYKCLLPTVSTEECTIDENGGIDGATPTEVCQDKDEDELVFSVDITEIIDQANSKFNDDIDRHTPLALMAWGAQGAEGSGLFSAIVGGEGGKGGFASLTTTLAGFENRYDQSSFYFFIGEAGDLLYSDGDGGSSTLLMLVESNPSSINDIVLIAAGGGGGEGGSITSNGEDGGQGGIAASFEEGQRLLGIGGSTETAFGGSTQGRGIGGPGDNDGRDGIGGMGGVGGLNDNSVWLNGDPDVGSDGRGGNTDEGLNSSGGGGGGGGLGGGGAGHAGSGAGGGSWINRSTITCNSAPNSDDVPSNPGTVDDENSFNPRKNGAVEVWIFPDGCG